MNQFYTHQAAKEEAFQALICLKLDSMISV